MPDDERGYFRMRAEQEIAAAQTAAHPDASRAHYLLAGYYLDLAFNPLAAPLPAATERCAAAGARVAEEPAFA